LYSIGNHAVHIVAVFAPFDVHMNKQGHFASKQIGNSLHKRAFLELKIQSKFFHL
jgi:hypothetical protein